MIFLPQRWKRGPVGTVEIDPSNGLVEEMLLSDVWTPSLGTVLTPTVNQKFIPHIATGTLPAMGFGTPGYGMKFTGTVGSQQLEITGAVANLFTSLSTCSILLYRQIYNTATDGATSFVHNLGGTNRILTQHISGTQYWDFVNATAGAGGGRVSTSFTRTTNAEVLIFVAGPNVGREIWRDGIRIASDATANAAFASPVTGFTFQLGATGSDTSDSEIQFLFVVGIAEWSPALIREISINPWQIFKPRKTAIYLNTTAVAGSSIKTINGLALASIKTVNGLAIASVKTVNGLA